MNYYSHHIGDFRAGTINMSRLERWLYRDMVDVYYDTEKPLPLDHDELFYILGTTDQQERTTVERLLKYKFEKTLEGYRHFRCDAEIHAFHKKGEQASVAGKASAASRATKKASSYQQTLNGRSTDVEQMLNERQLTNNQEPITNNQEPIKNNTAQAPKFNFAKSLLELGADQKAVKDWMAVRKKKNGANTETALAGFVREATSAGLTIADAVLICAERSWCGINADWLKPKSQASPQGASLGSHGMATAAAAQRWLDESNEK